jgi:hypothetical protein
MSLLRIFLEGDHGKQTYEDPTKPMTYQQVTDHRHWKYSYSIATPCKTRMGSCTVTVHAIMIQYLVGSDMLGISSPMERVEYRYKAYNRVPVKVAHVHMPKIPRLLLDQYSVK